MEQTRRQRGNKNNNSDFVPVCCLKCSSLVIGSTALKPKSPVLEALQGVPILIVPAHHLSVAYRQGFNIKIDTGMPNTYFKLEMLAEDTS